MVHHQAKAGPAGFFRRMGRCWQLYALILPAVATVGLFHYVPIYGVLIAFKNLNNVKGVWGSPWVGLKHFQRFVTYPLFWNIIRNTVEISLYSMATFPCSVIFALMLNELDNLRLKRSVQMLTYAPHFVSTVVVCAVLMLFLERSNGLLNHLVAFFGGERKDFLGVPAYFSTIYVWSGVWTGLGWGTIVYVAALANVPVELVEAARIDGASRMQVVLHVNIPTILPTIITMLILRTGSLLSVGFEKVYLLQNSLNLPRSRVISTYVYEIGLLNSQFSYSTAIGLFNNVVNIVFIIIVNTISKKLTSVGLW